MAGPRGRLLRGRGRGAAVCGGGQYEHFARHLDWSDVYRPTDENSASPPSLLRDAGLPGILGYRISWFETIFSESDMVERALERFLGLLERSIE